MLGLLMLNKLYRILITKSVKFFFIFRAVVLAYKLPGLRSDLNMTREVVTGIYNGTIRWWNDSLIQQVNPQFTFPYKRLLVVARADKSGTTSLFTQGLSSFNNEWNNTYGSFSTSDKWIQGVIKYFGSTSSGVAGILMSFDYTIGYLSAAAAKELRLNTVSIENGQGIFTKATAENIQDAMNYYAQYTSNLTFSLHNADGKNSYPIAGFTHFIVYKTKISSCLSAKELVRYVDWFMTDSVQREVCISYGMTPLSTGLVQRINVRVLKQMKCNGKLVWDMVQSDIAKESEKDENWDTIVAIVVPLCLLLLICFSGYIVFHSISHYRRIYNNDWFIPIDDIIFYYDKRVANSLKSKLISGKSIFSFQSASQTSEYPELVSHIIQWPGKWGGNNVGLRLTTIDKLKKIDRPMKSKMLTMKDKINHCNIVRFFGLTELENDNYVISEYCGKGQLIDLIQNEKFDMTKELQLSLALDIAQGMTYLHSKNIIHGHLSSSTCLIDSKWTVKVCDWEFNTLIQCKDEHTNLLYELHKKDPIDQSKYTKHFRDFWTAPEVLRIDYKCRPTSACDVFSFAIILQEIYTREDPYSELADDMTPEDVINAVVHEGRLRPKPSEEMPLSVRQCMEISWSNDPLNRPSFDQILKMMRRSSPTIKTVLDSMMEAMEDYTLLLEERIDTKAVEFSVTIRHLQNLLHTYIPPPIVTLLTSGQRISLVSVGPIGIVYVDIRNLVQKIANIKKITNKAKFMTVFHRNFQVVADEFSAFLYSISFSSAIITVGLHSTNLSTDQNALITAQLCLRLHSILKNKVRQLELEFSICGTIGKLQESMIDNNGRYQLFGAPLEKVITVSKMTEPSSVVISSTLCERIKDVVGFSWSNKPKYEVR